MALTKAQQETAKLRAQDAKELRMRLAELDKELFDLRTKIVTKEQQNTAALRKTRREVARVKTVLQEKQAAGK